MKLPLRTLLIVPFLIQVLGITGLVGYLSYRSGQRAVQDLARQLMAETGYRVEAELGAFLQVPQLLTQVNANLLKADDGAADFEHLEEHWLEQVQLFPQVTGMVATDRAGTFLNVARLDGQSVIIRRRNIDVQDNVLYRYRRDLVDQTLSLLDTRRNYDPQREPPENPWYEQAQQSPEAFWRLVVALHGGKDNPMVALVYFQPVYTAAGAFRGVASTGVVLPEIGDFLQRLMADRAGQIFVVDADGYLVATSTGEVPFNIAVSTAAPSHAIVTPQRRSGHQSSDPLTQAVAVHLDLAMNQRDLTQESIFSEFRTADGHYFVQTTPLEEELDWLLVTVIPSREFMAAVQKNLGRTVLLCAIALLGAIGLGIWTSAIISKPILSLQRTTQAFTEGWITIPPTQPSPIYEVDSLRQKFDQMVTQLVTSFRLLRDRENTLATFLNGVPVAISVHDQTGRILFLNKKGEEILPPGIADSSLERLSADYALYVAGTDELYPTDQLPIAKGLRGEAAHTSDLEVMREGGRIPLAVHTIPVFDGHHQVVYCITTFQDMTEQRQAEALRANYERELEQRVAQQMASLAKGEITKQALINAIPDLLIRLGRDGHPLEIYNIDTVHWMGDKTQLYQRSTYDGLPLEIATARSRCIEQALATGQVQRHEYEFMAAGQTFCEEARVVPVTEDEVLVVVRDISDRRRVERMKDEFIAIVSHELRTPLTAIRGALGILETGVLSDRPEKAQRMLSMSLANTDRLIRLVNDILDLERLTSGQMPLIKEVCAVTDLMDWAIDGVEALALESAITLHHCPIQATLWAAPDAVVQTLINLLSNAIKFSPAGSTVYLTAEVVPPTSAWTSDEATANDRFPDPPSSPPDDPRSASAASRATVANPHPARAAPTRENLAKPYVLFSVVDQGRGIPTDRLQVIFDRFQQIDVSDSRQRGGTGLGLAICKKLVEQHGGTIWAESQLGQGSTFHFTLPQDSHG